MLLMAVFLIIAVPVQGEAAAHIGWSLADANSLRPAAFGSSQEDLVGVFSIQKNIVLASDGPGVKDEGAAESLGQRSARLGPKMLFFDFHPLSINASNGSPVTFTVNTSEPGMDPSSTWAENLSTIRLVSPSGGQSSVVRLTPTYLGDNQTAFLGKLMLPPTAEPGRWRVHSLRLVGSSGHSVLVDTDELVSRGFPSSLNVQSAGSPLWG